MNTRTRRTRERRLLVGLLAEKSAAIPGSSAGGVVTIDANGNVKVKHLGEMRAP